MPRFKPVHKGLKLLPVNFDRQLLPGSFEHAQCYNESAKMATNKGVIQGHTGVAAVDEKHQIIVCARAHGTGSEQKLLLPVVEATSACRTAKTIITADAGYHSEANLKQLSEQQVDAYIPDNAYRTATPAMPDRNSTKPGSTCSTARIPSLPR